MSQDKFDVFRVGGTRRKGQRRRHRRQIRQALIMHNPEEDVASLGHDWVDLYRSDADRNPSVFEPAPLPWYWA